MGDIEEDLTLLLKQFKEAPPYDTEEGKRIWKNDMGYFGWLRGGLRTLWQDYPLRKEWKKSVLRPVTPEEKAQKVFHSSTKNVGQCAICKEWMAGSKLESDHLIPSKGCKSIEEAIHFFFYCAASLPEHWQPVCKACHKIKTHSERKGISFEEAKYEKQAIPLEKKGTAFVKAWIEERGVSPESNKDKRREQIISILKEEEEC